MKRTIGTLVAALILSANSLVFAEAGLTVTVLPGKKWSGIAWFGIVPVKKSPQFAVWTETADGRFVETLSVTSRAAEASWIGNPEGGRPDALPVWFAASRGENTDAVSSATPDAKSDVGAAATGGKYTVGEEYMIRLEVNHSFDYNDTWPKNAKEGSSAFSGVNGQPSLVYEGRFVYGRKDRVKLTPIGIGSVTGANGLITRNLSGLTTALQIISEIIVTLEEISR